MSEIVPIDQVEEPNPDEKLHPKEQDNDDDFDEMVRSIEESAEQQPISPPIVAKQNGKYRIIDGDRRVRAAKQAGVDEVEVVVRGDDISKTEIITKSIIANEHRKPSDRYQRARQTAQIVAPWLLHPGERDGEVEGMSQGEFADRVGKVSQSAVSQWLDPLKNERYLRDVLGRKTNHRRPTEDEVESIDNIMACLQGGNGHKVMIEGEESVIADSLDGMNNISIGEVEGMAEKAVEEEWNTDTFIEETKDAFGTSTSNPAKQRIKSGPLGGMEDTSPEQSYDTDEGESVTEKQDGATTEDTSGRAAEGFEFDEPNIDVDWDELVSDKDLEGVSVGEIVSRRRFEEVMIQDEAAVAINMIHELTGQSKKDIASQMVEPVVVEEALGVIEELTQDE